MAVLARRTTKKATSRGRPPRPAQRERLETHERREQLLTVAMSLFLERPYDQVSMDDLAARAGVSKGLVFHYFGSKRELYVELVRRGADDLLSATDTPEEMPPLERLHAGLLAYLRYVEENAAAFAGLFTNGMGVDPEITEVVDRTRRALAERILTSMPTQVGPHAGVAARGFIGFVEATTLAWLPARKESRDELIALFVRVLGTALAPT
ncbi:MAG: TetR/AcrR family transcriptional regulator [Myxococcales bacterium]|nr:TetR/AcrR family transcriptional regulator [Myxococcales bacterium]